MSLTTEQIGVIQSTWATAEGLGAEAIATLLFAKIFEAAPGAAALFSFGKEASFDPSPDGLAANPAFLKHGVAVVNTVGAAVKGLNDLGALVPVLQSLGYKHMLYHVKPEHYPVVGAAFLGTLRDGLGDAFTPDVEKAYTSMWGVVADTMLSGAVETVG